MKNNEVLSKEMMEKKYGSFYGKSKGAQFDIEGIPDKLTPLIPYAEFWGISDDWEREELIQNAPAEVLDNLISTIRLFDAELDNWLAGSEAKNPFPSDAYIAFSAMRMGADFA